MRRIVFGALFISLNCLASGENFNNDPFDEVAIPSVYENYRLSAKVSEKLEPLSHSFSGESIDYYSGNVTFTVTDVDLKGNFPIPVAVVRKARSNSFPAGNEIDRYGNLLGNWDLAIPSIEARVANKLHMYCGMGKPDSVKDDSGRYLFTPGDYFNGLSLNLDNGQSEAIYQSRSGNPAFVPSNAAYYSKSKWYFTCQKTSFVGHSPDGLTYTFNRIRTDRANPAEKSVTLPGTSEKDTAYLTTHKVRYQVSRITDRFGNYVQYNYTGSANLPSGITSSDGRSISFIYKNINNPDSPKLESVTSNNLQWSYEYNGEALKKVVRPDGRFWQYQGTLDFMMPRNVDVEGTLPTPPPPIPPVDFVVTHPEGAVATFTFSTGWLHRLGYEYQAYRYCWKYADVIKAKTVPCEPKVGSCYNDNCRSRLPAAALTRKKIQLKEQEYQWTFQIDNFDTKFPDFYRSAWPDKGIPKEDKKIQRVVTQTPDGREEREYYRFKDGTEGDLFRLTIFDASGNKLQATTDIYERESGVYNAFRCLMNTPVPEVISVRDHNCETAAYQRRLKTSEITTYGASGEQSYQTEFLDYNIYGQYERKNESSAQGRRYLKYDFVSSTSPWLLNLPQQYFVSATESFDSATKTISYNSLYLPETYTSFGKVDSVKTYHADGTLKDLTHKGVWAGYSDYYRGVPRDIRLLHPTTAAVVSARLEVDGFGRVTRVTDLNGYRTDYEYDAVGRLKLIDPFDTSWDNTIIEYQTVNGSLNQTLSQGNLRTVTTFDGLLRPVKTKTWDSGNETETVSYVNSSFDHENRQIFQSVPSRSSSVTRGTYTAYDALGRIVSVTRPDGYASSTEYLSGHEKRETDASGNSTTTTYLTYGRPGYDKPLSISAPEGVTTTLAYNLFGNITGVEQGGITEQRIYDAHQHLCMVNRVDVGSTGYAFNSDGNKVHQVEGLSSQSDCIDVAAQPNKTTFGYNSRGLLSHIDYADSSDDVSYGYDGEGQLKTLTTAKTSWGYDYNSKGLIELETLTLSSPDQKTFILDHQYNSLGALSAQVYPSGRRVDYAPNALGQASKAGHYITQAGYYPGGQLSLLGYANGLSQRYTLNSNDMIEDLTLGSGSKTILNYHHKYDTNLNIYKIEDRLNPAATITLGYDGLDRLTSASGAWGHGSFDYDELGNLKHKTLGSQSLTYHYDQAKNRLTHITGSTPYSFGYDDRGNVTHNGKFSLTFNRANQVTSANGNSNLYDGHKRRVKKSNSSGSEYSFYSLDGRLYRTEKAGTSTEYIYLGKQLVAKDIQVATGASGTAGSNVGYTGHLEDKELGLTYMQQRYYDPVIGRFYSNDPVGFSASNPMMFNRYAYANNNPYRFTDPDGRTSIALEATKQIATAGAAASPLAVAAGVATAALMPTKMGDGTMYNEDGSDVPVAESPDIKPSDVAGKTPEEIGKIATDSGLIPKGPDPQNGKGAYVDPATDKQRVLIHPDASCGPHCHVNDANGNRLDINGNVVAPESPEAHLPIDTKQE